LLQCLVASFRYRLKTFVWLALVAMCGLAIGPTISRALGAGSVDSGSMHAMHADCPEMASHSHMAADGEGHRSGHPGTPGHSSNVLDCCALCAVASSPFAIVAVVVPELSPAGGASGPVLDRSGTRPEQRELWSTAVPRGPPLRS